MPTAPLPICIGAARCCALGALLFNGIKNGRKNARGELAMDPFGAELNDQEIEALVAYVRTLAK